MSPFFRLSPADNNRTLTSSNHLCIDSSLRDIVTTIKLKLLTIRLKVSQKELENQTVKFTVIDNGRPRKRQTIGHLLCSLKNISIENGKQVRKKKGCTLPSIIRFYLQAQYVKNGRILSGF